MREAARDVRSDRDGRQEGDAGAVGVRYKGCVAVETMDTALKDGGPGAAQRVAAECVVEAKPKHHQN